jgi:spore germination protein YaaH
VAALAGLILLGRAGDAPPRPRGLPPRVFAFLSGLGGDELRRLRDVGARIDVVAPNWHEVDVATGALSGAGTSRAVLDVARRRSIEVWPVVNARTGGSEAIGDPAARSRIAGQVDALAGTPGVDGITLDVEELLPHQRDAYTALVAQIAARVHARGRRLAVYVSRQTAEGGGRAYDYPSLAEHADLLLAAGYNEHWSGGPPGPVTTSAGFEAVLGHGREAAGDRAAPVLGAFGYRWPPGGPGALIGSDEAERLAARLGVPVTRQDGAGRFRAGADSVVFETAAGLRARVAAARRAHVRWIALFSLGREPASFWRGLETARAEHAHVRRQPKKTSAVA